MRISLNSKRFLTGLIPFLFLLVSCSSNHSVSSNSHSKSIHSPGPPTYGDWLIRNLGSDPQTLNPVTSSDLYSSYVNDLIFSKMIDVDSDGNIIPSVATSWNISKDNKSFIFHLRSDVKFHDGVSLTAYDVKYTWDKIMDPKSLAENKRADFEYVDRFEVINKDTLRAVYKIPFSPALESWGFSIIPKHIFEKEDFLKSDYNKNPIGSGPYVFQKWKSNQYIMLTANNNYWGTKPYLKKIVFKMIPDQTVSFNSLLKGDLDVEGLTPLQWKKFSKSSDFENKFYKMNYYTRSFSYIAWNANGRNPFFKDKKVRQAMSYSLNRELIKEKVFYGLGELCSGPFYPKSWANDTTIKPIQFDLNKARLLLSEAGWKPGKDGILYKNGVPFRFKFLLTSSSDLGKRITIIYQEDLRKIGVILEPQQMEWATFLERIKDRDYEAATLGWSLSLDPDPYMIWHSSQIKEGLNYVNYSNPEVDRLIEEGRTTFNVKKRTELYHRIHQILADEQPYTFMFHSPSLVAVDRRFQDVKLSNQGLGLFLYNPGQLNWWVPKDMQKYRRY